MCALICADRETHRVSEREKSGCAHSPPRLCVEDFSERGLEILTRWQINENKNSQLVLN